MQNNYLKLPVLIVLITISINVFLGFHKEELIFFKKIHFFEKSGEEILTEIGMGTIDIRTLKLSDKQFKEVSELIKRHPFQYNAGQKSIIEDHSAENILNDVGMGIKKPEDVKLTAQQVRNIYNLIKLNPENYNKVQKSLIRFKSGSDILQDIGLGKTDPKSVKLTNKQKEEIKLLIEKDPSGYNESQKSLLIKKQKSNK